MAGLWEGGNEPPGSLKAIVLVFSTDFTYGQIQFLTLCHICPSMQFEILYAYIIREVGYDGRDWINLAQDRDQWRVYVRAAMNLRVP
ncbi:hypothetical protein ANN_12470 [Periplaneta americana]|uniref:Uncharacterized protein n=1 Tax=Periplaneta americana TaxID=6978 RepID=A0ABQ8TJD2_PERAM|nr:hypothetical protein ANN_12470 [Periplaneta americana]